MGKQPSVVRTDICVIGAGASGMTAALSAYWKNPVLKIVLVEEKERIGQKILVTGNGRCNLSNRFMTLDSYNDEAVRYESVFRNCVSDDAFFARLGLMLFEDESGRIYPYSNQASSVLNAFLSELERTDIRVLTGRTVTGLKPGKNGITVEFSNGELLLSGSIILATGTPASARNNRSGELIRQIGDRFVPFVPALVPIRIRGDQFRGLKGIRLKAAVKLQRDGKTVRQETGEVQFGDGYLGGICVMDLSRYVKNGDHQLVLDLIPDRTEPDIFSFIDLSLSRNSGTAASLLNGILPRRVGEFLMRSLFLDAFSRKADSLSGEEVHEVVSLLKHWIIPIESRCPMSQAQVCMGGADGLERETLASACDPRVFYCGEIVNVDGRCGGFNLHWAWISGKTAGEAAASLGKEKSDA